MSKLSTIKNIIWALCIVLCLLVLLVGLIFAAFTRYGGEQQKLQVSLGAAAAQSAPPANPAGADAVTGDTGGLAEPAVYGDGTLRTLGESQDAGQAYVDSLTFLCDSILVGLRDYGLLTGGTTTGQVWGSSAGNIPAASIASPSIRYPGDGSEIGAASAAMLANPGILVISLGMDGLGEVSRESFIADYTSLISSIRQVSPSTVFICCSLSSVTANYSGADGLTVAMVQEANSWIEEVCMSTGAYYADFRLMLQDSNGNLQADFASANGKALNSAGINKVLEYLRMHAVQG